MYPYSQISDFSISLCQVLLNICKSSICLCLQKVILCSLYAQKLLLKLKFTLSLLINDCSSSRCLPISASLAFTSACSLSLSSYFNPFKYTHALNCKAKDVHVLCALTCACCRSCRSCSISFPSASTIPFMPTCKFLISTFTVFLSIWGLIVSNCFSSSSADGR